MSINNKRIESVDSRLRDLKLLRFVRIEDSRGYLSRIFCEEELREVGWARSITQINQTRTSGIGSVRGLHYQEEPHSEAKIVQCIRGAVWDVAVDIRTRSATYGQWDAYELSAVNKQAVLIPRGFAHGFQALTDDVEMLYFHDQKYVPNAERGIDPRDPSLCIQWPLPVRNLSSRDASLPPLKLQESQIP